VDIKTNLLEMGLGGVDWIGLALDGDSWRDLDNTAVKLRVSQDAGKLSSGYTTGGLWSGAQLHRVSS
jgi:hypothetical protein